MKNIEKYTAYIAEEDYYNAGGVGTNDSAKKIKRQEFFVTNKRKWKKDIPKSWLNKKRVPVYIIRILEVRGNDNSKKIKTKETFLIYRSKKEMTKEYMLFVKDLKTRKNVFSNADQFYLLVIAAPGIIYNKRKSHDIEMETETKKTDKGEKKKCFKIFDWKEVRENKNTRLIRQPVFEEPGTTI